MIGLLTVIVVGIGLVALWSVFFPSAREREDRTIGATTSQFDWSMLFLPAWIVLMAVVASRCGY